jgi:hypothetical protein
VPPARPTFLGHQRLLSSRHKKNTSTPSTSYAFPNEYSIPTIPLPPSPDPVESLKPPESPPRFRRREHCTTIDSTPGMGNSSQRETSVRFNLPNDEDDEIDTSPKQNSERYPVMMTSTPNPSGIQQFLDHQADSFDSAKSFISAYQTPSSPSNRFRRDSPSKLLRTLSRATSLPPSNKQEQSIFHSQYDISEITGSRRGESDEEEVSLDEADKTLDSIIESTQDASIRIRKVLEQSRLNRSIRQQSLSPETTRGEEEDNKGGQGEMSVWGEKSFFRRMAKRAPGGWAFTPQPKLGRVIDVHNEKEEETEKNVEKVCPSIRKLITEF